MLTVILTYISSSRVAIFSTPVSRVGLLQGLSTVTMNQFQVPSVIRGYHVYRHKRSPVTGEEPKCLRKEGNDKDPYAVVVTKWQRCCWS